MEVFVAIVEFGSFTAAANAFRITPAMVSKHVSSLEKRLGATLLARTTRTQKMTEIGRTYYENCKHILDRIADAEAGAEAMSRTPKGHLRISASTWFGSLTLSPIVCDYLQQFPEVNIELSLTDRHVDIVDEGFDVAIRIGDLKDSSLVARKLSMFDMAICASPDYVARAGKPKLPKDLAQHQCLGSTDWRLESGWTRLWGSKLGLIPRFQSENRQALRIAAVKGMGIILMPREMLRSDIEAGRLIELMKSYVPRPRPIHAVYTKERRLTPKLTSFLDYLVKRLRP